jgi:CRP-like cAMP-binding protein
MTDLLSLLVVAGVGLFTTSAVIVGATIGLYLPLSRPLLGSVIAFAAGVLIASLSIELAFHGAEELQQHHYTSSIAWAFVGAGFALGALIYFTASRVLDKRGAAIGSATRFRQYVLDRKKEDIELLAKCDLLRHLPPDAIDDLLSRVDRRRVNAGEVLFRAGDPGDALYVVANGKLVVLQPPSGAGAGESEAPIAELSEGSAFGEMALLSGTPRTATIRAEVDTDLLRIDKKDFDRMIAADQQLAAGVRRLSHSRAISNLAAGSTDPDRWAAVAQSSLDHVSRRDSDKMLAEAGRGAGLAIMLGDLLDTIPGLLVIGASFVNFATLSFTVMMGIFIGGIPESAASAALLRKAGFSPRTIYGLWSITFIVGAVAAVAGKVLIGDSHSPLGVFIEAMAGGSLLALVAHAMMPEAFHQGGSIVVIPTVAGFLVALYLIVGQASF